MTPSRARERRKCREEAELEWGSITYLLGRGGAKFFGGERGNYIISSNGFTKAKQVERENIRRILISSG